MKILGIAFTRNRTNPLTKCKLIKIHFISSNTFSRYLIAMTTHKYFICEKFFVFLFKPKSRFRSKNSSCAFLNGLFKRESLFRFFAAGFFRVFRFALVDKVYFIFLDKKERYFNHFKQENPRAIIKINKDQSEQLDSKLCL